MQPAERRHYFRLSTGREFYAHGLRLSLGEEGCLAHGWDQEVDADRGAGDEELGPKYVQFTKDERLEIAEYMIALYAEWAVEEPETEEPYDEAPPESVTSASMVATFSDLTITPPGITFSQ